MAARKLLFFISLGLLFFQMEAGEPELSMLKIRQPHWRMEVLKRFPEGAPQVVLFFAKDPETGADNPVKQMTLTESGALLHEIDLDPQSVPPVLVPHGPFVIYYPDGTIKKTALFSHGTLTGPVKIYYSTADLHFLYTAQNDVLEGPFEQYDEAGHLAEKGSFANGARTGLWEAFYPDGSKASAYTYENGLLTGDGKEWHPNGKLKSAKFFARGVLNDPDASHAAFAFYSFEGTLIEKQNFFFGQPHGPHVKYHAKGKQAYSAYYENGLKQGHEVFYAESGKQTGKGDYENGTPIGTHETLYESGKPAKIAKYDSHGVLLEPVIEYDTQGNPTEQYRQVNGRFLGEYTEWFPSGKMMRKFFYRNGSLEGRQEERR